MGRREGGPRALGPYFDGAYHTWYVIKVDGQGRRSKRRFRSEPEALDYKVEYNAVVQRLIGVDKITLGEALDLYMGLRSTEVRPRTAAKMRGQIGPLVDSVGSMTLLSEVMTEHIEERLDGLGSQATVASVLQQLRRFFAWAIERGHLSYDPTDGIAYPRNLPRGTKATLRTREIRLLRAWCMDTDTPDATVIWTLLVTGLRCGELLERRVVDADLEGVPACIEVRNSKTKASDRHVPITDTPLVSRYRALCEGKGLQDYLFGARQGSITGHISRTYIRTVLRRTCEQLGIGLDAAGVCVITTHSLRATYSSRLQSSGMPLDIVSRLLGHASIGVTQGHYTDEDALYDARIQKQRDMIGQLGLSEQSDDDD